MLLILWRIYKAKKVLHEGGKTYLPILLRLLLLLVLFLLLLLIVLSLLLFLMSFYLYVHI